MVVATLGFVLRALVPAGFMPDATALQAGYIELTLCSPASAGMGTRSVPVAWSTDTPDLSTNAVPSGQTGVVSTLPVAPSHPAGSLASPADCPFGLMAAQGVIAPPEVRFIATTNVSPALALLLPTASLTPPVNGPPLGPRAPPAAA